MQVLESYKGQDISAAFKGQGTVAHLHSRGARALLERYCVGVLEGSEDAAAAGGMALPDADLVDEGKPLLPQVSWCMGMLACVRANTCVCALACVHACAGGVRGRAGFMAGRGAG
jgi:hypothetical protein